jgi:hypothetical protein
MVVTAASLVTKCYDTYKVIQDLETMLESVDGRYRPFGSSIIVSCIVLM